MASKAGRALGCIFLLVPCACTGESARARPTDCGARLSRTIAFDEETRAGSARALLESISPPQNAPLRWYTTDGASHADTTVELSLSGNPGPVTYSWYANGCQDMIQVRGVVLHFRSADGAFNEDISGSASSSTDVGKRFDAALTAPLNGSYDSTGLAPRYGTSALWLSTSFWPAIGRLVPQIFDADPIAEWTGTDTAPIGDGGSE